MENPNILLQEKITKPSSAAVEEDHVSAETNKEDEIESAKAKVGEVKEENERLKLLLSKAVKDYELLQMRFLDILHKEKAKKSKDTISGPRHEENEELVSLSLGRSSCGNIEAKKEDKSSNGKDDEKASNNKQGLALGLECKSEFDPAEQPVESKAEEEEPTEIWPPKKVLKTEKNGDLSDEIQLKKPRVSVRTRCDTPTMNDGCQWRKYGQKIAKGNPCPRAYYRCTVSPTCPVRKQVQRCAEDMSILITTYEGNHNHPLPLSATAMASTTSAAASMLLSQSSTSTSPPSSSSANLLNFSQNSRPYYFHNSSISTSNSHPTITLDLTSPLNASYFSTLYNAPTSTCLNFSSSSSPSWNTNQLNHKDSLFGPLMNLRRQPSEEHILQSYMQMADQITSQQSLSETIMAATKAITSNPSFHSALAAALTSFVGNGCGGSGNEGKSLLNKAHNGAVENEVSYLGKSPSMVNSHEQQQKQFPTSLPLIPRATSPIADALAKSGVDSDTDLIALL